ncbi:MAG: S-layer homology domain-containing protein [Oscillospiraceae bacterium]
MWKTVEEPSGTFEPDEPEKYTYHLIHDFNYEGGTTWDIQATTATTPYNLDVNKGTPERKGYNFLGWADKSNATTAQYYGGNLIELDKDNLTKTIYAVWKEKTQPDITDPTEVTPEFLDTASIHYVCDTCTPSSYYIDITSAMYKVTEHSETTFRIKWNDEAILKAYNDLYPGHTWDEQGNGSNSYHIDPFAMTWTWDATTQKWTRSGSPTIRAYVKSTASSSTEAPTDAALSAGSFSIASVYCGYPVEKTPHNPYEMACSAVNYIKGSFVENSAVKNANGTYTVKIRTAPYVDYFNQVYVNYNCPHAAKTETVSVTLAYTPDDTLSEWQVVTVKGEKQRADIPVYCEKAPDAPSITLTYNANAPAGKTVTNLPEPQKESIPEGSTVVTFQLSKDIPVCEGYKFLGWASDTRFNIAAFPVENLGTDSWVSTTGNPNYILYAVWEEAEVIPEPKEIVGTSNVKVFCLNPAAGQPNCNKIEYGVSLAFKRSLTKDETNEKHYTLELNAETYANAYTGNRGKGNESVAHNLYSSDTLTWDLRYEDGKWNAYPRETGVDDVVLVTHAPQKWEEVGKIAPRTGVDTTCVTSGKYANYGLTAAFLHYNTDVTTTYDKATKSYVSVIKPDTYISAIEKGCNGLTGETRAHKLTTKEALTWIFSVESVNGTTASWKAEPKTEADRKVTVKCLEDLNVFVVPAHFDDSLTELSHSPLNAATLDRIGFKAYDEDGEALLAGSFQSNAAIQADPDVDDVAEELLENGTFQIAPANNKANFEKNNILEKTDWTYVEPDENYMRGVLMLYSVKFETEDAANVQKMPAANYDGGINDYYLVGETLTLPAEKPTRTGYTFKGWKASLNPDISALSDPATDADAELMQPGAEITVPYGDMTFTAVWEPVEYTITYNWRGVVKPADVKNVNNPETFTADDLPITLKAPDFKNNEWPQKFLNWRDAAGNVVTQITESGNVELYAYYQFPVRYTVYDENDQKVDNLSVTDWYNEDDFADYNLKSGEQTGHDFDGWYQTTKDFGNTNKRVTKLNMAKKYELVGKLTRKEYTVTASLFLNGSEEAAKDARGVVISRSVKGLYGDLIDYPELEKQLKEAALAADAANKPNPDMADINICLNDKSGKPFDAATYGQEGYNWRNMQWPENNPTKKWIVAYAWAYVDTYYDVTLNVNMEGVTPVDTQTVKCNETATAPAAPTKEGYKFLGWFKDGENTAFDFNTPITQKTELTAKWELDLQTVNVVIYRNGDMTKEFKTVALDPQPKGTVIDLTKLNIADYYTANYTGKYDFYGWFNDGAWNEYKKNPERAGLDSITVNGWTNIICMVYDYENVVYYMSDADRVADNRLFATTARKGAALPTADAPTATRDGYTFKFWSREGQSTDVSGQTVNGWTNLVANWEKKSYNVVAKLKVNGELAYDPNNALYTQTVSGKFEEAIDFASIEAWALDLAEKTVHPDAASYTVEYEDGTEASLCSTYGQHEIDQETHTIYVNVKTTEHVYVYRMVDGVMQPTEYHHSTAPFGANVVEHLNANVTNLDMPGYSHDEWFKKDVPALDVKLGDTDTINGWTNVVIKYTKNKFPVTYDYACTDPALEPNWKVWETLPENPYTYAPGESVRVAMMPDDVEDGEYIWKFVTWKLNGVDVVPNAQVPMVEGGLTFVGIWERTQKEYGVTYDYACTDPALVPNWKVWATLPENKDTYTVGQKVTTAAKPDDVEDGEYIWKFVTWKLGDTEVAPNTQVEMVAGGLTFVGIWEHTQKEYGVTYSYDPSLPDEVQATLPKNPDTYTVGQKVTTAAKPNSVRVGEYIWTFKTWKLDGVEVAPNTQVEMVAGGLHFEGIWQKELIHYSLTIQYVNKKGKELAESHKDLLAKGEAYKVDSPKIKGYKLEDKHDAVIEGTMPGRNLTIEVVYIKKSTGGGSGTIDSPNKPTTKAPALTLNTDDHFAFINGYPDGSVQPEGNVTRAETAAILYRIMGDACQSYYKTNSSSYSDVARGDWYNTYVATLENAGVIVDTRTNGKFRPNDAITRAELASMIAQFAGLESASAAKFNDVGSRYWAAEEIAIAAKMGWINGYPDGSFRPDRNVTRAELMAMVNRALGRTPKSEDDLLSGMKTWRDNANVNAWYYLDVQEATNDHTYTKSGIHETWKKLL